MSRRRYITYDDPRNNRKPFVLQINEGSDIRVFRFRFEKNRDRALEEAKRGKQIVIAEG